MISLDEYLHHIFRRDTTRMFDELSNKQRNSLANDNKQFTINNSHLYSYILTSCFRSWVICRSQHFYTSLFALLFVKLFHRNRHEQALSFSWARVEKRSSRENKKKEKEKENNRSSSNRETTSHWKRSRVVREKSSRETTSQKERSRDFKKESFRHRWVRHHFNN